MVICAWCRCCVPDRAETLVADLRRRLAAVASAGPGGREAGEGAFADEGGFVLGHEGEGFGSGESRASDLHGERTPHGKGGG